MVQYITHEFKTYINEEKYINAKLQNVFDAFGKRYDENQMESCIVTKYNRQRIISNWSHKEWYKVNKSTVTIKQSWA